MSVDIAGRCTLCGEHVESTAGCLCCRALKILRPTVIQSPMMHPTGECTCAGECTCDWCKRLCQRCVGCGLEPAIGDTHRELAEAVRDYVRGLEDHDTETSGRAYFRMIDLTNAVLG